MTADETTPPTPKKPPTPATEEPKPRPPLLASRDSVRAPARCKALTRSGKPCGAHPMRGEQWCYQHHPDYAEEARANRLRAARMPKPRAKQGPPPAEHSALETPEDIRKVIEATIGGLLRGTLDRGRANAILVGCGVALKAVDLATFEKRLAALEAEQAVGKHGRKAK